MRAEVVGSSLGDLAGAAAKRDTPSFIINELVDHEGRHASKDTEGHGVFGLLLVSGIQHIRKELDGLIEVLERELEIVVGAFYRWIGDRTPETLKNMAEAVGEASMSDQDRRVRDEAKSEIHERERRDWFRANAQKIGPLKPGEKGTIINRGRNKPTALPLPA